MSGNLPGVDAGLFERFRDAVGHRLERRRDDDPGTVIEVRGTSAVQRTALVKRLQDEHDRPVFRLAPEDLVAAPHDRAAAVLRLLDAAEVAGAIPLLEAAETLAPDPAAAIGIKERLHAFRGLVVIATDGPSAFKELVADTVQPG